MLPLVSVVTITYNHAPYIAKCIEGVLMQQVNFPMEFIIAEDCSTDGTLDICEKYAEKYPELIQLLITDHNLGANPNELRALKAARGKYIAYCEGDDYWTEPHKLQRQVDFMESHPDYSVCFHDRKVEENGVVSYRNELSAYCDSEAEGFDLSMKMFFHNWITFPFSMVFRSSVFDCGWYRKYAFFRDTHMIFHFLLQGKAFIHNFVGGVRTIHNDSLFFSMDELKAAETDMLVFEELYLKNKNSRETELLKNELCNRIAVYLDVANRKKQKIGNRLKWIFRQFRYSGSIKKLLRNLGKLFFVF